MGDSVLIKITQLEHDGFGLLSIRSELEKYVSYKLLLGLLPYVKDRVFSPSAHIVLEQ